MLFNSAVFLIFFSIVYPIYLRLDHLRQNRFLLVASYIFYGWWDVRFLALLFISSSVDFICGRKMDETSDPRRRKLFLCLSLSTNLIVLGFFKYYDFFIGSFQTLAGHAGLTIHLPLLHVVLPVGISFYTFQAMSYSIDIYRNELKPTKSLGDFLLSVSFFPHLVAGPIQRASNLLAQITAPRRITEDKVMEGAWLFFYGLFQKAFVADNLAKMVDPVFASTPSNGAVVLLGVYAYAFQIYCDFAGYSNMARGLAKLMGFELVINFKNPYFSTSPREFWHRWHISLSTWLRDYVYIPLGGSRINPVRTYNNLFLTMLLGGLWHGAAWHFVFWGMYHGFLLAVQRWWEDRVRPVDASDRLKNTIAGHFLKTVKIFVFFQVICAGWVFFRATSMDQAVNIFHSIVGNFQWTFAAEKMLTQVLFFVVPLLVFEILEYAKNDLYFVFKWNPFVQGMTYFFLYYSLMIYGIQGGEQFVYFQF